MRKQLLKKLSAFIVSGMVFSATANAQWVALGNDIYNTNTGKVGIGTGTTTIPSGMLTVKGAGSVPASSWVAAGSPLFTGFGENAIGNADYILSMASAASNARPVFVGRRSRGTLAAPTALANNDFIMSMLASGYDGAAFQNPSTIDFFVDGAPSAGNIPTRISFVTGSNSGNRAERLKIGNTGDITMNANQLFLQKTSGNLGLGTITPAARLDVLGAVKITDGTQGLGKVLTSDANGLASWTTPGATPWSISGNNIFNTNTANVGIGTTTPSVKLDVKSASAFTAKFNGGSNMYMGIFENDLYRGYIGSYAGNAADVDFGTGGGNTGGKVHLTTQATPRLTIDSIGQVGIGTTTPTAQIDVFNNTVNRSLNIISSAANGQIANISTTVALNTANDLLQLDLPATQGPDAQFIEASAGGTKFAVNSDGRVGIGGSALANVGLHIQTGTDAAPASGGYLVTGATSGENLSIDNNEIMARNNGVISTLFLQNNGGTLAMCANAGNVTIGTTTVATGYKLSVNGKIIGTEVRVEAKANWPDYVFNADHKLLPLEDLEASINANKHLPGIPSATEVKNGGIMLGEMQTKQMEKIEELTLYMIQLNKENKELKARLEKLEKK